MILGIKELDPKMTLSAGRYSTAPWNFESGLNPCADAWYLVAALGAALP